MLVLTRKQQERIQIGDNITVTVVRIFGNVVRVGIEAPGEVRILRGELADRESQQTADLVSVSGSDPGDEASASRDQLGSRAARHAAAPAPEPVAYRPRPLPHLSSLAVPAHAV